MRIAFVADQHGNAVAFDAVVADLAREDFDEVISLGDVAQGGPQPVEVVDRLRELGWRCVFGNSDEFLLTLSFGREEVTERVLAVGEWSRAMLGEERLEFLQSFESTLELDLDGRRLVCCHATPTSNEDVILPAASRGRVAEALGSADVVACGHVHLQWLRRVGLQVWFSVGSAGLVWEHMDPTGAPSERFDPWAEYAVLAVADGCFRVEFRRVAFDLGELLAAYRGSGMPHAEWYASQWKT
jgi:predicted phosphodiesterase